jgi:outer membrane protein assembly factor BamB
MAAGIGESELADVCRVAFAIDLVPIWKTPIKISPPTFSRSVRLVQGGAAPEDVVRDAPKSIARESQRPLSTYPTVVGGTIVYSDGAGIHAARLDDGQPAITTDGVLRRNESADGEAGQQLNGASAGIAHGVPRLTLDVADGNAFARVGPLATTHVRTDNSSYGDRIIGLDLGREGLLTFQTPREASGWSFDGAPVCDGRRVFVAMRQSDVTPRAYVACFDAATGAQQWRTAIGAADTPAGGEGDEITHNLLTLVEDRIYFNTNLGLVTALDAESGDICWISRYERFAGKTAPASVAAPLHFDRDPSPCVFHDGLLIVAPSDAAPFFALDAVTGKLVWEQDGLRDVLHVLGVSGRNLIVSGKRIAAVDVLSGRINWAWPESEQAGIRGMGRGVIAGNEIFWPTRNEIYALDPKSGAQTRSPISLKPLEGGANLAASQGRLVVAGYDELLLLAPAESAAPKSPESADATVPKTGRVTDRASRK